MKVLVTGGGGFLGQAVVRGLLQRGHEVRVLNRSSYPLAGGAGRGLPARRPGRRRSRAVRRVKAAMQ